MLLIGLASCFPDKPAPLRDKLLQWAHVMGGSLSVWTVLAVHQDHFERKSQTTDLNGECLLYSARFPQDQGYSLPIVNVADTEAVQRPDGAAGDGCYT